MTITIISAMAVFTVVTLVLVCLLLIIKGYLTPKGKVKININCSRPGVVIGKAGAEIENLRKDMKARRKWK